MILEIYTHAYSLLMHLKITLFYKMHETIMIDIIHKFYKIKLLDSVHSQLNHIILL